MDYTEVGKRIKQRREELAMTQEDLGNLIWLNKSTIQRYETGKFQRIKRPIMHALAKQLNVSVDWLLLQTNEKGSFIEKPEDWFFEQEALSNFSSNLTFDEKEIIEAYRSHPELHAAIRRMLEMDEPAEKEKVANLPVRVAARSGKDYSIDGEEDTEPTVL